MNLAILIRMLAFRSLIYIFNTLEDLVFNVLCVT